MDDGLKRHSRPAIAGLIGLALVAAPLAAAPVAASTAGDAVVINEVYLNGGSGGATFSNKYIELYNPTDSAVSLVGKSVQYRSAAGVVNPTGVFPLTGTIPAKGNYLIQGPSNGATGVALTAPDDTTTVSASGTSGTLFLANQTAPLTAPPVGSLTNNPAIIDLVGWGASNTFETTATTAASATTSIARTATGTDTDVNSADFTAGALTPTNSKGVASGGGGTTPTDPPPTAGTPVAISAIQGAGDTSPLAGQTVTARGVVTANYATGGFAGYYIQTPGTGGNVDLSTHTNSDAIFVYSAATAAAATLGSYVEVTGVVSEFSGTTEITVVAGAMTTLTETVAAPTAAAVTVPTSAAGRESLEGMLIAPDGDFTVTDNYDANFYGSVVLNPGTSPLISPTTVAEPGSAEYTAKLADNVARAITLDDGSSLNFNTAANKATKLPYLSTTNPVRIGAAVEFTKPVILEYRFSAWNFQPTQQLTFDNAATVQPATFENTRTEAPLPVGGDITLASFNVLNYFPTTGDQLTGCSFYTDRAGAPITVNSGCDARGAANAENLERQQDKIVAAINALDADVVSLEEIENSASFNKPRDFALSTLVAALNADTSENTWSFVPSPAVVPASEDVIRTAFIYKAAKVKPVGTSVILDSPAFVNARQPLAQEFELADGTAGSEFLAIVNHFKSKGSGTGEDADQNDGQGASNASRVKQANALVAFADTLQDQRDTDRVFLLGDFNAYLKEDPIDVLAAAGYVDLGSTRTDKETYAFDGAIGSLDHIFASAGANDDIAGVDIWNINSVESIALEYSRYNYNALDLYDEGPYRSSDHDPILVGLDLSQEGPSNVDINLLNINDFHGRIDENTVKFAGTVETLRAAEGEENTLFLSDGDNIGASLFASSSQKDQPTIDVLNALELDASAVGNHEFDQGLSDLTGRVNDEADWTYLGANVYKKGTTDPALPEYEIFEVDGVRVAVIGAVTIETPTLVSPGGVSTVDFGDPVAAVNRVVTKLEAGDLADVFIAEYHEGAGAGTPDGASLEQELALSESAFAKIVTTTSADVDAIFTGHTHKEYSWDAQVPGAATGVTRPVLQTGSYGANIGQIVLTVDPTTDEVVDYTAKNVKRLAAPTTGTTAEQAAASAALDATLIADFPRVKLVDTITKAAVAKATEVGSVEIGEVAQDITTAYTGNGAIRDDRANESTLGNLVADSIVDTLSDKQYGSAEIGVVNPGGLRAELKAGKVTYSQANAVLPFANNLWTTTLTGAQFKTLLEQQWQRTAAGAVPSRPYLALGLSKNVTYTYDATRAEGDRITGITVNGAPIDPAKGYRIGTFSFLLEGGDNFHIFKASTGKQDSGLVDRDAWIDYITDNSPLSPSFARRGVSVTNVPTGPLNAGYVETLTLSKLNLTSLGSPLNTTVSAAFEGSDQTPVKSTVSAEGTATVAFFVPRDLPANATLVITAKESGTTVRIPFAINADPVITGVTPTITGTAKVGSTLTAVTGDWSPSGTAFTYQWNRAGKAINGATKSTYTLIGLDATQRITVSVTGTFEDLPAVTKPSFGVTVAKAALSKTPTPKISGTAKVGKTLTVITGTWGPAPVTLKAQWKRNGVAISGAVSSTYKLRSADKGKRITVTVTGSKVGYVSVAKASFAKVVAKK